MAAFTVFCQQSFLAHRDSFAERKGERKDEEDSAVRA
jgi:hypothetical protein